ncbi:MAG: sugar transferase [Magnetococcales bacterium]|nr:sugar transferase [Magnetococcales bacterium]
MLKYLSFGGYDKQSFSGARLLEYLLCLILLILSIPVFLILPPLIKLQDGGPVFFKSLRMGKDKVPFHMYKFRTLISNAEQIVGGKVLDPKQKLETPIGRFLRDVRLDEIPQLINVLRGEMDFFGPRPERPAVYEAQCKAIPGYEKRFEVNPGLMGYAQLFTPHTAPKKIRTLVDNIYVRKKQAFMLDFLLGLYATLHMARYSAVKLFKATWRRLIRLGRLGQIIESRTFERLRPKGVEVSLSPADLDQSCQKGHFLLGDISEEFMLIYLDQEPEFKEVNVCLSIRFFSTSQWQTKIKRAKFKGEIYKTRSIDRPPYTTAIVVHYNIDSPLNRYIIDKYFLKKSIF